MMLTIPEVLTPAEVAECRAALAAADWRDGRGTAGHLAAAAKDNQQLDQDDPLTQRLGDFILERLGRSPRFMAAALPLKVLPPRFNRYAGGGSYGNHTDSAVFSVPRTPHRIRADLSATLFLSAPDEYEGGELIVADHYGEHRVKLPAGQLVLYPGGSLHRVAPVSRGQRLAAFFWIQSLVRRDEQRAVLLELDEAIQALAGEAPGNAQLARLNGVYHNLLRQWAET